MVRLQIEDDVLAHPADSGDTALLQRGGDFCRRRFERLFLLAQPDRFDSVSGDSLGKTAGDGFNFGEFRHSRRSLYYDRHHLMRR